MDEEIEVRTGKPSRASLPKMGKLRFGLWRRRFAVSWALAGESWWRLGVVLVDPVNRACFAASSTLVCLQASAVTLASRVHGGEDRPL